MASHFFLLVLFAVLVSVVFATLQRDEPKEQVRLTLWMTSAFVGAALALGWLMFPLPL
ncbi:MAG: hypothetical protein U0Q12_26225 [Vicinamibacterales bacterium]